MLTLMNVRRHHVGLFAVHLMPMQLRPNVQPALETIPLVWLASSECTANSFGLVLGSIDTSEDTSTLILNIFETHKIVCDNALSS